jgi:hypothetical protein
LLAQTEILGDLLPAYRIKLDDSEDQVPSTHALGYRLSVGSESHCARSCWPRIGLAGRLTRKPNQSQACCVFLGLRGNGTCLPGARHDDDVFPTFFFVLFPLLYLLFSFVYCTKILTYFFLKNQCEMVVLIVCGCGLLVCGAVCRSRPPRRTASSPRRSRPSSTTSACCSPPTRDSSSRSRTPAEVTRAPPTFHLSSPRVVSASLGLPPLPHTVLPSRGLQHGCLSIHRAQQQPHGARYGAGPRLSAHPLLLVWSRRAWSGRVPV